MPNDGIRLKIILIIEVRKLEFTDFDSHSHKSKSLVSPDSLGVLPSS